MKGFGCFIRNVLLAGFVCCQGNRIFRSQVDWRIIGSSNKTRLFPPRTGEDKTEVSYGEAARWLLYVNGYDDTSAKPKGKICLPQVRVGLEKLGLITC